MIIKNLNISFFDLEEDDKIEGYKLKDLIAFAKVAQKANISDSDLKQFMKDASRITELIREEISDAAMSAIQEYMP